MWSKEHREWILTIDNLFTQMFGSDFFTYCYDKTKGAYVDDSILSALVEYNHDQWEIAYLEEKGKFSEKESSTVTPKWNHRSKKLDFTNAQTSPLLTKTEKISSSKVSDLPCIETDSSTESVIILDEEDAVELTGIHSNVGVQLPSTQLSSAITSASTRAELAALGTLIPPVSSTSNSLAPLHAQVANNDPVFTDPFTVVQRPCETVITNAEKLLSNEKKKGNHPSGVVIQGCGQFSEQGLRILRKFCSISETKQKVTAEARWLSDLNCPAGELALLETVLWNQPVTNTVLRFHQKAIDVLSFCDLAEERYIDSFIIDVCIGKFIEESTTQGKEDTIFFPTEFFQWMQASDKAFKLRKLEASISQVARPDNLLQILVPVFMVNHWGLIYINLGSERLYFDDGLASAVPSIALPCVKEALNLLLELCPHHPFLKTKFWHNTECFKRFGMPSQVPIDRKMIGVGSCGIGVIMAARDFIRDGAATVDNIKWRYSNMHNYRKDLMLQILLWSRHQK